MTFVRTDLRRYSVWDKQELEAHHIRFEGEKDPLPPGVLLLYVSETAAGPIQQVLNQLCDSEDGPVDNGESAGRTQMCLNSSPPLHLHCCVNIYDSFLFQMFKYI